MSSKFESTVREIHYSQKSVYDGLSNLENLEKVKDRIPADKVKDFTFDKDSVSISIAPVGQIKLHVVDEKSLAILPGYKKSFANFNTPEELRKVIEG